MAEAKPVERTEVLSGNPTRLGKYDVWIVYEVEEAPGKKRQGLVILPKEDITDAKIADAIRAQETERARLLGKSFTV